MQALPNAGVYVCVQKLMWADRLKTNYMNKTWKIVFSSSLCFSNAHYFLLPLYLFVAPFLSVCSQLLSSRSRPKGTTLKPWQTVAPSLESFPDKNTTLKQVIITVYFGWNGFIYYLFLKNKSLALFCFLCDLLYLCFIILF